MTTLRVTRTARLPDPVRVARYRRAPEMGPRLLFFSGGNALRQVSRRLKRLTHSSVHLVTPFDSGGSSAVLRDAFDMLSVGDLRNRIMALANESATSNAAVYRLFRHRFPKAGEPGVLRGALASMVRGDHALVADVPTPMRRIVRTHLRLFEERMPDGFDLRGASIGNLILVGGYLNNDRDMDSVVFLFSQVVEARGTVLPVVDAERHLAVTLEDGTRIVGQHRFTGKEVPPITSPIRDMSLVSMASPHDPAPVAIHDKVRTLIEAADLIVYPIGSYYSSVLASMLPGGVGRAIASVDCPKVFVLNTGADPEMLSMTAADAVRGLIESVRRDAGDVPIERVLHAVLIDTKGGDYRVPLALSEIRALGVEVVDMDLASDRPERLHARKLAEALVSLT